MASDKPLTVIVVDDQALFRRSIQDRLRSDGYDVVSAENGIEALELLQVAPGPCVVLLDSDDAGDERRRVPSRARQAGGDGTTSG